MGKGRKHAICIATTGSALLSLACCYEAYPLPVDELERDEKLSEQPHGLRLVHRLPLLQVRLQVAAVAVLHHDRDRDLHAA